MSFVKRFFAILWVSVSLLVPIQLFSQLSVTFEVDFSKPMVPISPYIYGSNQVLSGEENWTVFRQGGNRMTGYNWENNASNAGADWNHISDNYLTSNSGIANENEPGIVATHFHDRSLEMNTASILTVQMAGYAAKDKNDSVSEAETAPSNRWVQVKAKKAGDFDSSPDLNDDFVYVDEFINFMVDTYGTAASGEGIKGYCLDNEPALWPSTHPRIHPAKPTCQEIVRKGKEFALAIKAVDPAAEVFGPCLYGFAAYTDFQGAIDWNTVQAGKKYEWFIDYYLDQMKLAEDSTGKRLLDVLSLHWYPEAQGDQRITENSATSAADNAARVQAPRTLWDPKYIEKSWIGQWGKSHLPLIPKVKASIEKYYPGTQLTFNEITYGGAKHISGTIAMADALGIFAKYQVYMSALWPLTPDCPFISAAYKIFRNFDGKFSTFGDLYAESQTSDVVNSSIYGSTSEQSQEIHLIAINKSFDKEMNGQFNIKYSGKILDGRVWCVSGSHAAIQEIAPVSNIQNNSFSYTLPVASVCHLVVRTSE